MRTNRDYRISRNLLFIIETFYFFTNSNRTKTPVVQGEGCEAEPDPDLVAAAGFAWAKVQSEQAERDAERARRPVVVEADMEHATSLARIESARGMLPPGMSVSRFYLSPLLLKRERVSVLRCAAVPQHCRTSVRRCAAVPQHCRTSVRRCAAVPQNCIGY
jgi:hypothetical protein